MALSLSVKATTIRLITIGPGDEFWSAFGHTALAVDNKVYGFGYFSFEDEGLIHDFLSNQMMYDLGVSNLSDEFALAQWQNRTFIIQNPSFTEAQKDQIKAYLEWHYLPENKSYPYDYFLNNCSTKIRDLLDQVMQGELYQQFNTKSTDNYFTQTFPAKNQSLMNLGIVMVYGWHAYQTRTDWELMAFPAYLQKKMAESKLVNDLDTEVLFVSKSEPAWLQLIKTHVALILIFLFSVVLLTFRWSRKAMAHLNLWVNSTIGWILLLFWLLSAHEVVALNFNLLLFSPLAILMIWQQFLYKPLLLGYFLWLLIAAICGAWYLIPLFLINVICLRVVNGCHIK